MNDIDKFLRIQPNKTPPTSGKILLAEPLLQDPYFSRSVVFIIDNSDTGAFGLVLNRPTFLHIDDFEPELPDVDITIYKGGPVDDKTLFFLHTLGDMIPDAYAVANDIYCGGDWKTVKQLLADKILNDFNFRLFLGYSGWIEKQLDEELDKSNWVVSKIDSKDLFNTPAKDLWNFSVTKLGEKYSHWKNLPISPEMN